MQFHSNHFANSDLFYQGLMLFGYIQGYHLALSDAGNFCADNE